MPVSHPLDATAFAVVDGTVEHDRGSDSWPLGGVLVEVLEGGVVTTTTTTDENGTFHLELPPREIQFSGSKRGYIPSTTRPMQIRAGQRTITRFRIQPPVVLPAPPPVPYADWLPRTVTGRATDALGNAVGMAVVCALEADGRSAFACAGTDATGAFTIPFRVPTAERRGAVLNVSRTGYPTQQFPFECCVSAEPMVMHVVLPVRVGGVRLIGPTTIALGETVRITALVSFDDGSEVVMNPILFEVRGAIRNSARGTGMIEGWAAGSGPIWWSYQNVSAGLTITVTP